MMQKLRTLITLSVASVFALTFSLSTVWANDYGYSKKGHGNRGHSSMGAHGASMMHNSTEHLLRHLLKHEKDIALSPEQVLKLKDLQLTLDKTHITNEANIQIAERELKALTEDENSELATIETKLKQSGDLQVSLRMAAIKTRRDVLAVLTPEQRSKEKAEHEKMMEQHKDMDKSYRNPHDDATKHNPHTSGETAPLPPLGTKVP